MNWSLHFPVLRWLVAIGFVLACTNVCVRAQDPWSHFGDKHIGGDVPYGETSDEKAYRNQAREPREDRVLKAGPLAVSKADRVAFAAFLRTPNTGLIRLLPATTVYPAYVRGRRIVPADPGVYSLG